MAVRSAETLNGCMQRRRLHTLMNTTLKIETLPMDEYPLATLSPSEISELATHESIIERGLKTFYAVGTALQAIRDARLYRGTHATFEDYCQERWQMSRPRIYQFIDASVVIDNLSKMSTIVDILPANEAQARPLTSLPPEEQIAVWKTVVEESADVPITAKQVQTAVNRFRAVYTALDYFKDQAVRSRISELCGDNDEKINILIRLHKSQGRPETNGTYQEILDTGGFAYGDEMDQHLNFSYASIESVHKGLQSIAEYHSIIGAQTKAPHVSFNAGDNEWYTPPEFIAAAYRVLGAIDLDPASTEAANTIVKAKRFYAAAENGLDYSWQGKVWMNPPYASHLIKLFTAKFAHHVQSGDIPEGIVLVNNATETQWFADLISVASAILFASGRVRFLKPQGNPGAPLQGQAFIYIGQQADKFLQEFKVFGWGAIL